MWSKKPQILDLKKKNKPKLKFKKLRETVTSASLGGVLPGALKKLKKKVAGFPYMNNNCYIIKQKHMSEILWNEANKPDMNRYLDKVISFFKKTNKTKLNDMFIKKKRQ